MHSSAQTLQCRSITWRHRSELFILACRPSPGWLHGACPCPVRPCHLIPFYSCSSISVSQKPQGCPCLRSLVLVSSSTCMFFFCMFTRLPPSCQADLRLNVTSSKRPFLIPSLKQLLSCPLLHHPAHFLHGTHYSLMLLHVCLFVFDLVCIAPPTPSGGQLHEEESLWLTLFPQYIPAPKAWNRAGTWRVFTNEWLSIWRHLKEILLGLGCFAFFLWEWVIDQNDFYFCRIQSVLVYFTQMTYIEVPFLTLGFWHGYYY